jgi:hypothetical protein
MLSMAAVLLLGIKFDLALVLSSYAFVAILGYFFSLEDSKKQLAKLFKNFSF